MTRRVSPLVLALVALCAFPLPCAAKYIPLELYDLLGASDVVVVGTITEVKQETFVLEVETHVVGAEGKPTLEVLRFRDWPCARRWTPYEVGQTVLVCAVRLKDADGVEQLKIRSGGGEGEMPIADGKVRLRGRGVPAGQGHPTVEQLVATVRAYRACFELTLDREVYPNLKTVKQTADADALAAFRASSKLADHLAAAALSRTKR